MIAPQIHTLLGLSAIFAAGITTIAAAQGIAGNPRDYPTKPIRIITAGAGTFHDIVTRQLGQYLSERWGQPIVVDNKPGAGLTIGAGIAARAAPDGYTLLMADRTCIAAAPSLYKQLAYDPQKDLAPITLVATAPFILVAHPSIPASNLREFLDHVRRQSGTFQYASAGLGTAAHMTGELFRHISNTNMVSVNYRGGGQATLALVSGEVKAGFGSVANVLPHITAGRLKAYVITSKNRFEGAPNIPTAGEAGLPGFESQQWLGVLAPSQTPAKLLFRLNGEMVEYLRSPSVRTMLRVQGAEPLPSTPSEFTAYIKSETAQLKKVVELADIKPE